jgi:hypothetical protein
MGPTSNQMISRAWKSIVALLVVGAALATTATAAQASYCNSSTCSLSGGPTSSQIYFEMPRNTSVSMICWTDNQWFRGTNRWFKVNTIYGRGYMIATQVSSQTWVGHWCAALSLVRTTGGTKAPARRAGASVRRGPSRSSSDTASPARRAGLLRGERWSCLEATAPTAVPRSSRVTLWFTSDQNVTFADPAHAA